MMRARLDLVLGNQPLHGFIIKQNGYIPAGPQEEMPWH
jgi:hypothetical protein